MAQEWKLGGGTKKRKTSSVLMSFYGITVNV